MMVPAAQAIAAHVPASDSLKVIDIAAGHRLFAITIARRKLSRALGNAVVNCDHLAHQRPMRNESHE